MVLHRSLTAFAPKNAGNLEDGQKGNFFQGKTSLFNLRDEYMVNTDLVR